MGTEGGGAHIFGKGGVEGWLFFFMEAHWVRHCENNAWISLVHVSPCRDTGVSLIFFHVPLLPRGKSLAVTQFTFSKFTLCQKYPFHAYPFKIYTGYIPRCVENREYEGEGVRCICGKWPEKNIVLSSFLCEIVLQIVIKKCTFVHSFKPNVFNSSSNLEWKIYIHSNKKIIVSFF